MLRHAPLQKRRQDDSSVSVEISRRRRVGETLELALKGAGGEPVDLWRTLDSHGFSELPPMRLAEPHVLEVTLPAGRGRPRVVRISGDRFGPALVEVSGPPASA